MRNIVSLAAAAAIAVSVAAHAPVYGQDTAALSGLTEVKIAFDVTNGNSVALLRDLEVIDETRQSLIKQGVKPHIVIAFRGPATKLVQTDVTKIAADDRENAAKIAAKVATLHGADGVSGIEQCGVAVRLSGVDPKAVLPDIIVVGNGWISLTAYQAKGYSYIATD